jgi:hypothetical protein
MVGWVSLQGADRNRFVNLSSPANPLAKPWTDPAENSCEGGLFMDDLERLDMTAIPNRSDELGDIDVRRASQLARGLAVTQVIRQQQLESHPTSFSKRWSIGVDCHPGKGA